MRNAQILLVGGPFDGQRIASVPPDTSAPAQIAWSGWSPQGFTAWLYEWHGEVTQTGGYTEALIFRPTGRRLTADEIPPLISTDVEVWASGAALVVETYGIPASMLWPGV